VIAGTSFLLPKPIYPVSDREDANYTVEYVFNYARYNYTPAVAIKDVNRVQAICRPLGKLVRSLSGE